MTTPAVFTLPDLVLLEQFGGDWKPYEDAIYAAFLKDFSANPALQCFGKRVSAQMRPPIDGRSPTFWHIVSAGKIEEERIPDLRRCERVRWAGAVIAAAGKPPVRHWRADRHGDLRLHLAPPEFDYLVVLTERPDHWKLITAFYLERDHERAKRRKECEEWEKKQKPEKG